MKDLNFECVGYAYNLSRLPYISNDRRYSETSYDRTGGNLDYDNWLYEDEKGEKVIFDVIGPGCVYKMFFPTISAVNTNLRVYIDNSDEPVIKGTFKDIFSGCHTLFPKELVFMGVPDNSGMSSYMPIPFAKRLKITVDLDMAESFYYHIDYRIFPGDTKISSWCEEMLKCRELIALRTVFSETEKALSENAAASYTKKFSLLPNQREELFSLKTDSPSQITLLRIKLEKLGLNKDGNKGFKFLSELHLHMCFDYESEKKFQIKVPLSGLFGFSDYGIDPNSKSKSEGWYRTHSYAVGQDSCGYFYIKLPMPFLNRAYAEIVNTGNFDFGECILELVTAPFDSEKPFGYLNVHDTDFEIKKDDKNDIHFLDVKGSGNFVGIAASMDSEDKIDDSAYLEGDEHIYVDGSMSPQINGTGTEDFYNGAYYWYNGTHSKPLFGCSYNSKWTFNKKRCHNDSTYKSSAYRFLLGDSIPFRLSFKFDIEHGFKNDQYECGKAVLFYYLREQKSAFVVDSIDFSSEESLKNHSVKGTEKAYSKTVCYSQYEGWAYGKNISMGGYTFFAKDILTAQIKTDPLSEEIVLRRTFEYSFPNQCAEVYVDNEFAGYWYDSGNNFAMRLKESEFSINKRLVENKSSVLVRLEVTSPMFSVLKLEVFSYTQSEATEKSENPADERSEGLGGKIKNICRKICLKLQ